MESDDESEKNSHSDFSKVSSIMAIENTVNIEKYQNYIDRYFTRRFYINLNEKHDDQCVLIHSNRLCVLTLAPSHPLVSSKIKIEKIDFQVSKNINRLENKTSGKHKRNAQYIDKFSPICFIECLDKKYTISSIVPGKLIEINDKLSSNPEIIQYPFLDNYYKECYIAIILPKINISFEDITCDLLTTDEYLKAVANRNDEQN